jgi:hypothetical protein
MDLKRAVWLVKRLHEPIPGPRQFAKDQTADELFHLALYRVVAEVEELEERVCPNCAYSAADPDGDLWCIVAPDSSTRQQVAQGGIFGASTLCEVLGNGCRAFRWDEDVLRLRNGGGS